MVRYHAHEGVNADGSIYTLVFQVGDDNGGYEPRLIQHLTDPIAEDDRRVQLLGTIVDLVRYHFGDALPIWFSRALRDDYPDERIRTMMARRDLPPPGYVTWNNDYPQPYIHQTPRAPSDELSRTLRNMYHNEVLYANPDNPRYRRIISRGQLPTLPPVHIDPVTQYHTMAYDVASETPITVESAYNIPVRITNDEDCPLCLDELKHGGTYSRPPCGHLYCRNCMSDPRLNRCLRCNTPFMAALATVKVYKDDEIEIIDD